MNVSSYKLWLTSNILSYKSLSFIFVEWEQPHIRQHIHELQANYT